MIAMIIAYAPLVLVVYIVPERTHVVTRNKQVVHHRTADRRLNNALSTKIA